MHFLRMRRDKNPAPVIGGRMDGGYNEFAEPCQEVCPHIR